MTERQSLFYFSQLSIKPFFASANLCLLCYHTVKALYFYQLYFLAEQPPRRGSETHRKIISMLLFPIHKSRYDIFSGMDTPEFVIFYNGEEEQLLMEELVKGI